MPFSRRLPRLAVRHIIVLSSCQPKIYYYETDLRHRPLLVGQLLLTEQHVVSQISRNYRKICSIDCYQTFQFCLMLLSECVVKFLLLFSPPLPSNSAANAVARFRKLNAKMTPKHPQALKTPTFKLSNPFDKRIFLYSSWRSAKVQKSVSFYIIF